MILRRVTALVIFLSAFLALGVLSFLGNRALSAVFIVTAGYVVVRHSTRTCTRCSNVHCGFNPNRSKLRTGRSAELDDGCATGFSDLPITRTTVAPLLITGPVAAIGAWQYSPIATIVVAVVILTAHFVFRELTCRHCGNDCVGNCNTRYREWKVAQKQQES